jgi:hypothetical protein
MQLKVQGISNDPVRKVAVVRFIDVMDDFPQISVTIKLVTLANQTQAEVHAALKRKTKFLFEEAIRGLDRFTEP